MLWVWMGLAAGAAAATLPDVRAIPADLVVPACEDAAPAPGRRVRQRLPDTRGDALYHALYLPLEWTPAGRFPVIVEYAGNGGYTNAYGDACTGRVEDCRLGFGMSGGRGCIWVSMPFVSRSGDANQLVWWGDVEATVRYCLDTVRLVCEQYGGDSAAVILSGFSRGAIACGYIGLHDDRIADLWLAFVPHSHYDGVRTWPYDGSDRPTAQARLARLGTRASFVSQEGGTGETEAYLRATTARAPFTFQPLAYRNHTDEWVLRDLPERRALRQWLADVLARRPGTHSLSGRVTDAAGRPVAGASVVSGETRCTVTAADGTYRLAGLPDSRRLVAASRPGDGTASQVRQVVLAAADLTGVDFVLPAPSPPLPERPPDGGQAR